MRLRRPASGPAATTVPDHAWKTLSLVNDWLRHAESKLAASLTIAGVSGGVLFNLVRNQANVSIAFEVAAVACATAIFLAGVCAMIGLYPIVSLGRPPDSPEVTTNPLFFRDVARHEQETYWPALQALTADPDGLVRHIGQQIHANSSVALRKYRWADRSIRALLVDLLALASVATIAAFGW